MNLQVLGCAGGIGGREKLTTCLLVDHDILIDAGTGLSTLEMEQLVRIDHVFITHSHLDHVAGLALLMDAVAGKRTKPVTVHATEKLIATLKTHLFNWLLWPDFAEIPSPAEPVLRWEPTEYGKSIELNGREITNYPVDHTVDAVAYWVHSGRKGFLFTGDMASSPSLWPRFTAESRLEKVIVDCSFPNAELTLAELSKHFCPSTLIDEVRSIAKPIEFLIYHLKPGQEDLIMQELQTGGSNHVFRALQRGDVFVF